MFLKNLVFKMRFYVKPLAIIAAGLSVLLATVNFSERSPFIIFNPSIVYSLGVITALCLVVEAGWNWRKRQIAKMLLRLGVCTETSKTSQGKYENDLIPALQWRKNRSELLVSNLPQKFSLADAEGIQIALANHLRVSIAKVFHEPASRGFVFQIDRSPNVLTLQAIAPAHWAGRPHCGLIGNGIDNQPIPIDFNRSAVLDVRASSGSGKTEASIAIAASMLLNDPRICREIIVVDPKSTSDGHPSAQYQSLKDLCDELNIPMRVINPDECDIEMDDQGKIIKEDPIGLIKLRESFARIHREYQKLPSKTSPPDFYYLKICDEASSYLDPTNFSSKDKKMISLDLSAYANLWARLFRSVSWGMICICQSPKSDAIAIDQTNLQYRLLGHCGTAQMSINLIGDDRLYRDASFTHGKFYLIAIPEGYQGPVRTPFGGATLGEVRKRMKPRSGGGRGAP